MPKKKKKRRNNGESQRSEARATETKAEKQQWSCLHDNAFGFHKSN